MNRLDRYIAARYLANCGALFVALFAFVVGIDVFLNLKRFISAAKNLDPEGSALKIVAATGLAIIDLWGPRLLQLFSYLSGLVIVMAAGFTAAGMVRKRELVAALASGISLHRLSRPIVFASLVIFGFQAVNYEFFLPRVAHLLPRDARDVGRREIEPFDVSILRDGSGRLWHAARFEPGSNTLWNVAIWERDGEGQITRRIHADSATWNGDAWSLEHGVAERPDVRGAGEPILSLTSDLNPTTILVRQIQGFGQSLSWSQINAALAQKSAPLDPKTERRLERIRFGRVAIMTSNFCVLLIAMPFFLSRLPVHMVAHTTKIAPIIVIAMIGTIAGVTTPLPGLPVGLAVFFPTLVLAPIAIASLSAMKT